MAEKPSFWSTPQPLCAKTAQRTGRVAIRAGALPSTLLHRLQSTPFCDRKGAGARHLDANPEPNTLSAVAQWCKLLAHSEVSKPLPNERNAIRRSPLASSQSPIDTLSSKLGRRWPAIKQAIEFSHREKQKLTGLLANQNQSDTSIVVFGSCSKRIYFR